MKIQLTDPITGKSHTERVDFETAHPASHYGQPVMVGRKHGLLDHQNWILQGGAVLKRTSREAEAFEKWHSLIDVMAGR